MAFFLEGFLPSREGWELMCRIFQFFPLVTIFQWIGFETPMGKTSIQSKLNLPGKIGWMTMESPAIFTMLYIMYYLPTALGIESLPRENYVLAGLYIIHYLNRSFLTPLLAPSMSPIHPAAWLSAILFQILNSCCISCYLSGYGPTTALAWSSHRLDFISGARMELGLMIFFIGLFGNIFHDDELREIRRAAMRSQKRRIAEAAESTGKNKTGAVRVEKVYMVPRNGLFECVLYPHYVCEWVEWAGFWVAGGAGFHPARTFLINEIATMVPRAIKGKQWYVKKFGEEKLEGRKALIPGVL